jgi:uncharacterized protein YukJ
MRKSQTLDPPGWHALQSRPDTMPLDFVRTNLFDPRKLVPLPFSVPSPDNDLNEKLDHYIQRAMAYRTVLHEQDRARSASAAGLERGLYGCPFGALFARPNS